MGRFVSLAILLLCCQASDPVAEYRDEAMKKWDEDIRQLEKLDATEKDPEHALLFIGSSSIRLWETIAEDMAPWPVIRRGYGGARFSDLAVFIRRLVDPHQFDALVIFVANDIRGREDDKTPAEVLRLARYCVDEVRKKHPSEPIFFIAITPTSSRFSVWDQIQEVNRLIADYCEKTDGLFFIDTARHYLDATGQPRDELFRDDKLHLNREGYRLWGRLIREAVGKVLHTVADSPGR